MILQPYWDDIGFAAGIPIGWMALSPLPNGLSFTDFSGGLLELESIAEFTARWPWLRDDMVPKWLAFTDAQRRSACRVANRISNGSAVKMSNSEGLRRFSMIALVLLTIGCSQSVQPNRALVWDLSNGRRSTALNGGDWVPPNPGPTEEGQVYHVTGDRHLSMSVIIQGDRRFDFDSVRDAYANKRNGKIRTVNIASLGYSEEEVIERLAAMHTKWNGQGLADVNKWRRDVQNKSLRPHLTVLHRPTGPEDPSIHASIHYNFGDADNAWFIMVTYFWDIPLL